jgi:AcrR family transcriptional regulator
MMAETRIKIVNAAYEEIHKVGFQAASIQNILKDTGLTKGALYHYFPNKNELGVAVINEVISTSVDEAWIFPLQKNKDPILVLQQLIVDVGNQITQEDIRLGCPLNNLSQEMSGINEQFRDLLQAIFKKWMDAIEVALAEGKKQNYVAESINIQQFAAVFVATLQGCIGIAKNSNSKELLIDCGHVLINLLTTLRPTNWKSGERND